MSTERRTRVSDALTGMLLGILPGLLVPLALLGSVVPPVLGSTTTPPAGGDRPNLIVVLTDDMRADDVRHMPQVRRLMERGGMSFTDAVSPHPLCCPARAELVTGQYAQNNGVRHNTGRFGGHDRLDSRNTIATWFAEAGYRSALVGKYLNGYEHRDPAEPGWSLWDPLTRGQTDYFDFTFHDGTRYTDDYVTTRIAEHAETALIELSVSGSPFLAYVNHVAPHDRKPDGRSRQVAAPAATRHLRHTPPAKAPMDATPAFGKRIVGGLPRAMPVQDRRRGYLEHHGRHYYRQKWTARIRALQSVDEAVASLYATLDTLGETDNTYVVFTSDNGYSLGEHRLYRKNVLTTEALRVPLLVTGPGVRPGSTSRLPVSLVDLVATLADLASVTPGLTGDGASFAPTLRGADQTWRNATLIQTGSTRTRGRHPGWAMRGVRTSRFTFATDVGRGGRLLFDRTRDSHELVNRAGDPRYRKVERRLRRVTAALVRCRGAQCHRTFAGVTGLRPDRR